MKTTLKPSLTMPHNKPTSPDTPFVAIGCSVMQGQLIWARAVSHTFARRIAAALNHWTPGRRGY